MDPGLVGVFIPIMGILCACGFLGLKTWTNYKLKMRETPGGDIDRLTEAVQQLHDEVGLMREDVAELQERVDFTERMLSEVRSGKAIGLGDSSA